MSKRILVVDDEPGVRDAIKQVLAYEGHEVRGVSSGGEALTVYPEWQPQVVFLDVKMAGLDGIETLTRLRELDPEAVVVMISGHGTIQTALDATRRGAFDFLEKPLDADRLLVTVRNALDHAGLTVEISRYRREAVARNAMIGKSASLAAVREVITRAGPTNARVLITGENGTGKELVARAIHDASPRAKEAFVEVNCAAIPSELIESELFGHMKGSFTGAVGDRPGRFEQADGGTIFLDEIGDMSLSAQAKVLRVLQEGIVSRIGGSKPIKVDVRVVAATNKELPVEIAAGRFREDLYYRLNVVHIHLPSLRERRDDIPDLIAHFERQLAGGAGAALKRFDPAAIERLKQRHWAGNVRELRNAVERLLILAPGNLITAADVNRLLADGPADGIIATLGGPAGSYEGFMELAEKAYLMARLQEFGWNVTDTAKAMGLPRSGLYKRMEKHGLGKEGS